MTGERNLSLIKDLTVELNQYKTKNFNRVCITERCLTLNNNNYSFANGNTWQLNVQKQSAEEEEEELQDANEDDDEEFVQAEKHLSYYEVKSIQSIAWTSRQLIQCSYQDFDTK